MRDTKVIGSDVPNLMKDLPNFVKDVLGVPKAIGWDVPTFV